MKPYNSGSSAAAASASARVRPAADTSAHADLILSLDYTRLGGAIVLHCEGPMLSRAGARTLSSLIAEVLPSTRRMVVDLAGLASLDSGALGELVMTGMWADAARYGLKFSTPADSVRLLFESTNLAAVFDMYESLEDALSAMDQEQVHSA
ncbi:MAG: STAS domain-containing protein [Terriglobales bacterium]|jgi:anti-anti-sigma regulatory factor